ncbi:MAG: FHA domain-containing protein [Acidimicrobiia bacterium]|nr:FHA domain-containing protein [Acidimicrobiia bacterium]
MSRRLIVSGGSRPRELVLVDSLIVGRDPACDISEQNDPLMSRRHAAFTADVKDASVRDLGSRNGILVNGSKMPSAQLRNGDVVQIGHLQVKFVDEVGPFLDRPIAAQGEPFDFAQGEPAVSYAPAVVQERNAKTVIVKNSDNEITRKI